MKFIDKYIDKFHKRSYTLFGVIFMKKCALEVTLDSLVSISSLNQGKAAKIISELEGDDIKIVIKNNEPIAAILSVDRLNDLVIAEHRLKELEIGEKE